MAYYLTFDGVDDYVDFASDIAVGPSNNSPYSMVFDIGYNGGANQSLIADPAGFNDSIYIVDSSTIIVRPSGSNYTFNLTSALPIGRQILKIKKDSGFQLGVYDENDNLLAPTQSSGQTFTAKGFGVQFFSGAFQRKFSGGLYNIKLYTDFTETNLVSEYDPSASGGTGSKLPDTVGSNDGTLVNFPTDDSQWVFYSSGATYTITLDAGSYTYTGSAADVAANRVISLNAGSYSYNGFAIGLLANRSITIDAGSYTYTGNSVNLAANRTLFISPGSYSYTGNDIGLRSSRKITLDQGSYTYTGNAVTLTYTPSGGSTYTITLDAGSYSLSGQTVQLSASRVIDTEAGSYTYTGQNVALRAGRSISLDGGAYVVTGSAVKLSAHRAITLDAGVYAYTGFPVTLSYSGEVIALISGYSVNYKQNDVSAGYADDYIQARFL